MTAHSILEVTLFVRDVDVSAAFYRALGVGLFSVDEPSHPHHFDGAVGNTILQLFPSLGAAGTRLQLGFRVTNIADVTVRLDELGAQYALPGPMRLRTRDPDGNQVHLSQVRDDNRNQEESGHGRVHSRGTPAVDRIMQTRSRPQ
ncbi:VOC family protein [Mycolicibacterium moriokaense]|uniref:VOC family protein n=1 Tax=Mycolicibacterium moriokaense TaxID=39691 RepID=A0AAD1HC78_9MYCO|nr:VOC family protein [Mycolicibacterium moriokaense]MCV7041926.1 VOC family protein [Mycolicibacterium moriokaense]BBX01959.1 hypothetical protein MMOR_28950 [Mycolicibacterium moriokaense]